MQRPLFDRCQVEKTMYEKKLIFTAIIIATFFTACKKDNAMPVIKATGELIDGGSPTVDGAGFLIRLDDNKELKPDNLPGSLQVAGTRVRVELTYQSTDRRYQVFCGSCPGLPIIHIVSIRKI